jgi:hypothetical protein
MAMVMQPAVALALCLFWGVLQGNVFLTDVRFKKLIKKRRTARQLGPTTYIVLWVLSGALDFAALFAFLTLIKVPMGNVQISTDLHVAYALTGLISAVATGIVGFCCLRTNVLTRTL